MIQEMNQPFGYCQDHLRLDTLKDSPDVPQLRMFTVCQVRKQNKVIYFYFFYVYMSVLLNVCLCTTHMPGDQGKQKRALAPLGC